MAQHSVRRTTVAALAAATVAVLAGCGGDDFASRSAPAIQEAAIADMGEVSSLSLEGTFTNDGQELAVDLALDDEGSCQGTLGVGDGTAQFISDGGTTWIKADAAFWESNSLSAEQADQVVALVGDKWAKLPSGGGAFGGFCDLDQLLDQLETDDDAPAPEKGDVVEVDGREAIGIVTEQDGETTTTLVATEAPHHILRFEVTGGDEPGALDVSGIDDEVVLDIPPDDEVIDLGQLAG